VPPGLRAARPETLCYSGVFPTCRGRYPRCGSDPLLAQSATRGRSAPSHGTRQRTRRYRLSTRAQHYEGGCRSRPEPSGLALSWATCRRRLMDRPEPRVIPVGPTGATQWPPTLVSLAGRGVRLAAGSRREVEVKRSSVKLCVLAVPVAAFLLSLAPAGASAVGAECNWLANCVAVEDNPWVSVGAADASTSHPGEGSGRSSVPRGATSA
jgi:hypothetical protein